MARLSFYERRIFPWLNDRLTRAPEIERLRSEAVASARGRVLEIGFGSGSNLPHYPAGVTGITALDPNSGMHDLAAPRLASSRAPVWPVLGAAEHLPFSDAGFDTVVSTLTLCSVSDPTQVLAEARRVLRPAGQLLLLEHGLAHDPGVARWQQRLNRLENLVACGCHLNRPIADLVTQSGFEWRQLRRFYLAGAPRTHGWFTLGVATVQGSKFEV
jgi:ubiquinone/menaquinone biosynthesis C-methylase UbiE